ncbi:MAG: 30S ribosomal protein S12 methylthiotransferase RimO [Ignavibacteriales bacterium]|nr:MAG: 30S ribosomal protein S12 methylthiotransferase RimO [Ignavibacteriaceae bacterium]MBW7872476.1 30S ribosomal protein S12 methylthiotransferase RimO [Ignavibacteria bacterium]MCZ2141971.1 30S ribosomal protein S12 methylthiotransferase RimO [Ignavibacteriales bacterium]MBV6445137.1 Ribosomal protein S12 methylthiotransferase RimO [Ignavibacteriaceae bacterium]MBZ0197598.1 30S ribosomal protein S12 methylthiotransferase RimO [Ignavibacteriaceae bacterium]
MAKKVGVITMGCSKNTVDSERLMNQLLLNGYELTENPEEADTIILNTCGFIEAAKKESIDEIFKAVKLKNEGVVRNVIVAGCLSARYMDELKADIPEVDKFYGTEKYEEIIKDMGGHLKYELLGERHLSKDHHFAYLKISEGCDHPCSFCSIPIMRGKHHSKPMEELLEETRFLARNGVKELIVIAQDTTDYGKDLYGERKIATLLNEISKVEGIEWIRLMYAYPSHFPDDLIEEMATNPKILKYLDLPLQHISDKVLTSMRRGITKRATLELLNKLRTRIPDITLRTTIITGYPAETQENFDELLGFVKDFQFDRLGVFTFSAEENTTSFILGDPVPEKEKNRRKKRIMEAQKQISKRKNEKLVDSTLKVIIDTAENGYFIGRTMMDAPEIDGEVIIDKHSGNLKPGDIVDVTIYDSAEYDLFGTTERD